MLLTRLLQRALPAPRGIALRRLSDDVKPLAGRVSDYIARYQNIERKLGKMEHHEVVNVLVDLMRNGELSPDQVTARLPEAIEGREVLATVSADGLRFPVGKSVECRMGPNEWARGKVVGHYYREPDWPGEQKAPYQILLEGDDLAARTIWAPADTDDVIRAAVRFDVGTPVECCVGVDHWVRGTVVSHYYREPDWPMQLLAPYRVLLDAATLEDGSNQVYIWAPLDADDCIRIRATSAVDADDSSQASLEG